MSYETKRNVFKDIVDTLHVMDGAPEDYCKKLLDRYDAALPDDLPVIPFRAAEVIKANQADTELTIVLMRAKTGHHPDDYWINNHQNTFALAWVLGVWRVEETGEIVKVDADK